MLFAQWKVGVRFEGRKYASLLSFWYSSLLGNASKWGIEME